MSHTGVTQPLTPEMNGRINQGLTDMASQGLRTVGIAFKKTNTTNSAMNTSNLSMGSQRSRKGSFIQDDIE